MTLPNDTQIPAIPRVISPSPTPSESKDSTDGYFGPVTRSAKRRVATRQVIEEVDENSDSASDLTRRARTRSRSPIKSAVTAMTPLTTSEVKSSISSTHLAPNGHKQTSNGHLSPNSQNPAWSWRDLSRSPSPLGLIPIHRHWRTFVHKHEVPRKLLHVSIGFFTIWLYVSGGQTNAITPYLMAALIPIATTDFLRHNFTSLNRLYVRLLGALMRETEYDGWNGVIWYLLGAWIVLGFFPKDVGVMGVLLLSWCDTAASTFGRAYGRYTPRIRRGKSLAGSLAALAVGVLTAAGFWGYLAPHTGPFPDDRNFPFMFTGTLHLPAVLRQAIGLAEGQASISGGISVAVLSLWTGLVASASEVVDLFGWDDNLTIPVLSGMGIWAFLKVFG